MQILYWNGFSKRKNSTKQPSGSGTDLTVVMKDNTSREHPTFILSGYDWSMNYIQAFGDYYYVEDIITNTNGTSEVVCSIDPMATAKAEIGATNAFVEYTTNGNVLLADTRIPKKTYDLRTAIASVNFPWTVDYSGSYRLAVNNKNGAFIYSISGTDLRTLLQGVRNWSDSLASALPPQPQMTTTREQLLESTKWIGDLIQVYIAQFLGNGKVAENIRSCVWVPFPKDGASGRLYIGDYDTGIDTELLYAQLEVQNISIAIPWPAGVTDWRRVSCCDLYLYLPFVGVIQLHPYSISQCSNIIIKISRTFANCSLSYEVGAGDANGNVLSMIGTYGAETCCNFPIGIQSVDLVGRATSVVAAAAGIAAGGPAGAAAAAYGAMNFMETFSPTGTTIGGIDGASGAGLDSHIKVGCVYHPLTEDPGDSAAIHGIPLFEHRTISSLSGYVKCAGASVQSALNDTDKEIINGYLNSGFYYE